MLGGMMTGGPFFDPERFGMSAGQSCAPPRSAPTPPQQSLGAASPVPSPVSPSTTPPAGVGAYGMIPDALRDVYSPSYDATNPVPYMNGVSSPYGERVHPFSGERKLHNGVDLAANTGTPVYAYRPGTVEAKGFDKELGNYIVMRHPDGTSSTYGHLSAFGPIDKGSVVTDPTREIGYVGATGTATGPHVHFTLRNAAGATVDPSRSLTFRPQPPAPSADGASPEFTAALTSALNPDKSMMYSRSMIPNFGMPGNKAPMVAPLQRPQQPGQMPPGLMQPPRPQPQNPLLGQGLGMFGSMPLRSWATGQNPGTLNEQGQAYQAMYQDPLLRMIQAKAAPTAAPAAPAAAPAADPTQPAMPSQDDLYAQWGRFTR